MSATRAATRMTLAYNPTHNWEESLTMILPASLRRANIDALATVELDNGGLDDMPATVLDRDKLLEHLGRDALHGAKSRNFSHAYFRNKENKVRPRLYRIGTGELEMCEYVRLVDKRYASVMVIDVDRQGTPGGLPVNLAEDVRGTTRELVSRNIGPAWVGINPDNGRAQYLWLIDPVYADKRGDSPAMRLLRRVTRELGELLGHDPHFSHGFSRSPFYTGDSPHAYRWYPQHNRINRLGDLVKQIRDFAGKEQYTPSPRQRFNNGTELILWAKSKREQAQAFRALADSVEAEIAEDLESFDQELFEGVRIRWINGVAARDETAFRHALKVGHRLRKQNKRLTDEALIDAYEHAYNVAQKHGGDGRESEIPPLRDRLTMARRVRAYVTRSKGPIYASSDASESATTRERKALATMGRRGGQKAAQRWETEPDGEYAQNQRRTLEKTHRRKRVEGQTTRARIQALIGEAYVQTGAVLTRKQIMEETGLSRATVTRHLSALRELGLIPES